jgi:hypothetical protein
VTNLNTGTTTYVTQTGVSSTGTAVYSTSPTYTSGTTSSVTTCSGTLVTNSDGTRSCVVQVGTSSTGYPIYQVISKGNSFSIPCLPNHINLKFKLTRSPTSTLEWPLTSSKLVSVQLARPSTAPPASTPSTPATPAQVLWWPTATEPSRAWLRLEPLSTAIPFTKWVLRIATLVG